LKNLKFFQNFECAQYSVEVIRDFLKATTEFLMKQIEIFL